MWGWREGHFVSGGSRTGWQLGLVGVVGLVLALWVARLVWRSSAEPARSKPTRPVALAADTPRTLELNPETVRAMGLEAQLVSTAPTAQPLRLTGQLSIDPAKLVHVRARFPGEVVQVGQSGVRDPDEPGADRPLRVGDRVGKGQLLAVVWSREIGEKKSDLIDALSQLYLDRRILDRLRALPQGTVPQRSVDEAERSVEAGSISVARAERTLRSWRLQEDEIAEIRAEASRIHENPRSVDDPTDDRRWAEVDVTSPLAGVILERNVVPGDIVDTSLDLFKVADLTRLRVIANAYEDDLPKLEQLGPDERRWSIRLRAHPDAAEVAGTFDLVGFLVEPSQHTAVVTGWLDNPESKFRVGQFITATVDVPAPQGVVAVPTTALVDQGTQSVVFVTADPGMSRVTERVVAVRRRSGKRVLVASDPTASERSAGCQPLTEGEWVVTTGTVELTGALRTEEIERPRGAPPAGSAPTGQSSAPRAPGGGEEIVPAAESP